MAAGVQDWLQGRDQGRKTDLGGGCRKGPNVRGWGPERSLHSGTLGVDGGGGLLVQGLSPLLGPWAAAEGPSRPWLWCFKQKIGWGQPKGIRAVYPVERRLSMDLCSEGSWGEGLRDQLSPILTKGEQRRGPWPPWQQEGERLDTWGRCPNRHQRLEGPFSDHANPLSHWTAWEMEARGKKQVLGQGHRMNEKWMKAAARPRSTTFPFHRPQGSPRALPNALPSAASEASGECITPRAPASLSGSNTRWESPVFLKGLGLSVLPCLSLPAETLFLCLGLWLSLCGAELGCTNLPPPGPLTGRVPPGDNARAQCPGRNRWQQLWLYL